MSWSVDQEVQPSAFNDDFTIDLYYIVFVCEL